MCGGGDLLLTIRELIVIINIEQQERLHDNSGFEFSESEAETIYKSSMKVIDNGTSENRN